MKNTNFELSSPPPPSPLLLFLIQSSLRSSEEPLDLGELIPKYKVPQTCLNCIANKLVLSLALFCRLVQQLRPDDLHVVLRLNLHQQLQ